MSDPRVVVVAAVRNLAARRLGRAFVPLAALVLAGVGGGLAGAWSPRVAAALAAGAPLVAGALLVTGQRAVRIAGGAPEAGPWRWAGAARVLPWAWGFWALAVPGLVAGRSALARSAWGALALAAVAAALALRVLLDAHRVGELEPLAATMIAPAAEEGDGAGSGGAP